MRILKWLIGMPISIVMMLFGGFGILYADLTAISSVFAGAFLGAGFMLFLIWSGLLDAIEEHW